MDREIPKLITPPDLDTNTILRIDSLLYAPNDPTSNQDCLLIFGNIQYSDTAKFLESLLMSNSNFAHVIISGGVTTQGSESEGIFTLLSPASKSKSIFHLETEALNTRDNVVYSKKFIDKLLPQTVGLVSQWHHSLRVKLSFSKFYPDIKTSQYAYPRLKPPEIDMQPHKWFLTTEGIARTWAELIRLKTYGERGDIAYPEKIKKEIDEIISLTNN